MSNAQTLTASSFLQPGQDCLVKFNESYEMRLNCDSKGKNGEGVFRAIIRKGKFALYRVVRNDKQDNLSIEGNRFRVRPGLHTFHIITCSSNSNALPHSFHCAEYLSTTVETRFNLGNGDYFSVIPVRTDLYADYNKFQVINMSSLYSVIRLEPSLIYDEATSTFNFPKVWFDRDKKCEFFIVEKDIDEIKRENDEIKREIDDIRRENAAVKSEYANLFTRMAELENIKQQENHSLFQGNLQLKTTIGLLNKSMREKEEKATNEIAILKQALQSFQIECAALKMVQLEQANLLAEIADLKNKEQDYQKLFKENQQLKSKIGLIGKTKREQEAEIATLNRELQNAQNNCAALRMKQQKLLERIAIFEQSQMDNEQNENIDNCNNESVHLRQPKLEPIEKQPAVTEPLNYGRINSKFGRPLSDDHDNPNYDGFDYEGAKELEDPAKETIKKKGDPVNNDFPKRRRMI